MPDKEVMQGGCVDDSTFVGRLREMSEVRRLLPRTRLLTLTGAGGVGKTRLARRVAPSMRARFPAGVQTVDLAVVEDGHLLEATVAVALGLRDTGRRTLPTLVDHLADKRFLLVLDNCEHLLQECAELTTRLLRGAPRLRILATSRQALGVDGEQVLVVPPLGTPPTGTDVRGVARSEAVRLFAERAAEVRPGFAVDAATSPALARLSRRLDGLPLAIELAAVRLRTMPLDDLVSELDRSLDVLADLKTEDLPRHRTLHATMDWSFGLCTPGERRLWSRLSVFPGGLDLEAAEVICSGDGIAPEDVLDLVAGLVDKSILTSLRSDAGVRYRMLESLRAHGRERLARDDERALYERYRSHYLRLAERNRIDRLVPDQLDRYRATLAEIPNMRLALDLCFRREGDPPAGLRIALSLWVAWLLAGAVNEGRRWLERGMELVPQASVTRAMALWVDVLFAAYQGDLDAATLRAEECRLVAERTGDETAMAYALQASGLTALTSGDTHCGFLLMREARALHQARGDSHAVAVNLFYAASFGVVSRSPEHAADLGKDLLALAEARGAGGFEAYANIALGYAAWRQGDPRLTETRMRQAATVLADISDRWGLIQCLETLGWTACADGRHERAARLLGAAGRLRQALDIPPLGLQALARSHRDCETRARRELGARLFSVAYRSGARLGLDDAIAYSLSDARK